MRSKKYSCPNGCKLPPRKKVLREFDDEQIDIMYSESFDDSGIGQAIMNRLLKAAGHNVITL